jgi:hypothetical protein
METAVASPMCNNNYNSATVLCGRCFLSQRPVRTQLPQKVGVDAWLHVKLLEVANSPRDEVDAKDEPDDDTYR